MKSRRPPFSPPLVRCGKHSFTGIVYRMHNRAGGQFYVRIRRATCQRDNGTRAAAVKKKCTIGARNQAMHIVGNVSDTSYSHSQTGKNVLYPLYNTLHDIFELEISLREETPFLLPTLVLSPPCGFLKRRLMKRSSPFPFVLQASKPMPHEAEGERRRGRRMRRRHKFVSSLRGGEEGGWQRRKKG